MTDMRSLIDAMVLDLAEDESDDNATRYDLPTLLSLREEACDIVERIDSLITRASRSTPVVEAERRNDQATNDRNPRSQAYHDRLAENPEPPTLTTEQPLSSEVTSAERGGNDKAGPGARRERHIAQRDAQRNQRLSKMATDYAAKQREIRSKMGT